MSSYQMRIEQLFAPADIVLNSQQTLGYYVH